MRLLTALAMVLALLGSGVITHSAPAPTPTPEYFETWRVARLEMVGNNSYVNLRDWPTLTSRVLATLHPQLVELSNNQPIENWLRIRAGGVIGWVSETVARVTLFATPTAESTLRASPSPSPSPTPNGQLLQAYWLLLEAAAYQKKADELRAQALQIMEGLTE